MRALPSRPPIIRIANGTFYRHHPNASSSRPNPPLFSELSFELASTPEKTRNWCIVGPSFAGKTTFLQALRGRLLCDPPTARSYPYLSTDEVPKRLRTPDKAIRYVGFDSEQGGGSIGGNAATSAYLSARYESRREITDFSLRDFLLGNTELNPSKLETDDEANISPQLLSRVVKDLKLEHLLDLPVSFLSNGQGRRARIARALLTKPEVLLLDEPFMGLDPPTVRGLSPLLQSLAEQASPRLVLSARPQDPLPDWITHLVYLRSDCQIGSMGPKEEVLEGLKKYVQGVRRGGLIEDEKLPLHSLVDIGRVIPADASAEPLASQFDEASHKELEAVNPNAEPLVEMDGCKIQYRGKVALGNWTQQTPEGSKDGLIWTVRRGERWGVFGPNGSGKTTIVSLLCSDHPQSYSLPVKLFGRSRLPEPGSGERPLTFWDIQSRIGHSSPEVHQHMPRGLTIRQVVENAWSETFRAQPKLDEAARDRVTAALRWFAPELNPSHSSHTDDISWADDYMFGGLSFGAQRIALFIRSMIKSPDVVVLDEAFGGMDDATRDKCTLFLEEGEAKTYRGEEIVESEVSRSGQVKIPGLSDQQALICIAHVKEEVPDCVREWLCLPEANTGQAARFGRLEGPLRRDEQRWNQVWGF